MKTNNQIKWTIKVNLLRLIAGLLLMFQEFSIKKFAKKARLLMHWEETQFALGGYNTKMIGHYDTVNKVEKFYKAKCSFIFKIEKIKKVPGIEGKKNLNLIKWVRTVTHLNKRMKIYHLHYRNIS